MAENNNALNEQSNEQSNEPNRAAPGRQAQNPAKSEAEMPASAAQADTIVPAAAKPYEYEHITRDVSAAATGEKTRAANATTQFDAQTLLHMDVVGSAQPVTVDIIRELVIGRDDKASGFQPDLDLTDYGAYRLGLSRRHAVFIRQKQQLLVKDLSSRNGTFVNGARIAANEPCLLGDGDEVKFGSMTMRIRFQRGS